MGLKRGRAPYVRRKCSGRGGFIPLRLNSSYSISSRRCFSFRSFFETYSVHSLLYSALIANILRAAICFRLLSRRLLSFRKDATADRFSSASARAFSRSISSSSFKSFPHPGQETASSGISVPQFGQVIFDTAPPTSITFVNALLQEVSCHSNRGRLDVKPLVVLPRYFPREPLRAAKERISPAPIPWLIRSTDSFRFNVSTSSRGLSRQGASSPHKDDAPFFLSWEKNISRREISRS